MGKLQFSKKFFDVFKFSKTPKFAVGILYFLHISLVNIFDPSNFEANLFGPKTLIPSFSKKSTIPSTRGFSGPMITISILFLLMKSFNKLKSLKSKSTFSAIALVPAFPGIQKI